MMALGLFSCAPPVTEPKKPTYVEAPATAIRMTGMARERVGDIERAIRLTEYSLSHGWQRDEASINALQLRELQGREEAAQRVLTSLSAVIQDSLACEGATPPPAPAVPGRSVAPMMDFEFELELAAASSRWAALFEWSKAAPSSIDAGAPAPCTLATELMALAEQDCRAVASVVTDQVAGAGSYSFCVLLEARYDELASTASVLAELASEMQPPPRHTLEHLWFVQSCGDAGRLVTLESRLTQAEPVHDALRVASRRLAHHCRLTPPDFAACHPAELVLAAAEASWPVGARVDDLGVVGRKRSEGTDP